MLAVALAISGHGARAAEDGAPVVVAAHDLPAGTTLEAGDVALANWPADLVPGGAATQVADVLGARIGGPATRGEALTTARLLGAGPVAGITTGHVAVVVPSGPAGLLLRPGDLVDVYSAPQGLDFAAESVDGSTPAAELVAASVRVIAAAPTTDERSRVSLDGYVVLDADDNTAARLAGAGDRVLTLVVRGT